MQQEIWLSLAHPLCDFLLTRHSAALSHHLHSHRHNVQFCRSPDVGVEDLQKSWNPLLVQV